MGVKPQLFGVPLNTQFSVAALELLSELLLFTALLDERLDDELLNVFEVPQAVVRGVAWIAFVAGVNVISKLVFAVTRKSCAG